MLAEALISLRKRREHRRERQLTRAEFEAAKLGKFRRLVRYVNERSPYYRRIIAERGIDPGTCAPQDFPPLTKSLLMRHFDEIVTASSVTRAKIAEFLSHSHDPADLYQGTYRIIRSSGSSGEVGYFVYSSRDWARGAMRLATPPRRVRKGAGKFRLAFFGAVDGHYAGATTLRSLQRGLNRLLVDIRLFDVISPLPEVIAALNDFQPEQLLGYTTALKILAAEQQCGALALRKLIAVTTSGEVQTAADKALLERAFGCCVLNAYGSSEHLAMGSSLRKEDNIVLFDHELMYEFFDDHSLVTNLFNYTLPLIRYRMADVLRPVASSAHSPFLVVEGLVGRNDLQPVFRNRDGIEDFISPHTIHKILYVTGVTRFQLNLTTDTEFRVMVCLDAELDAAQRATAAEAVAAQVREILIRKRMENVRFEVVVTDDLPVDPRTRKFSLITDCRAAVSSHA